MLVVDWIMIGSLGVLALAFIVAIGMCRMKQEKSMGEELKRIVRLRNSWLTASIICLLLYYWCILNSILCTLIVLHLGYFADDTYSSFDVKSRLVLYSAFSLFSSITPYIVNFSKISKGYRLAYLTVEKQIWNGKTFTTEEGESEILNVLE